jgi:hypothetical protein
MLWLKLDMQEPRRLEHSNLLPEQTTVLYEITYWKRKGDCISPGVVTRRWRLESKLHSQSKNSRVYKVEPAITI